MKDAAVQAVTDALNAILTADRDHKKIGYALLNHKTSELHTALQRYLRLYETLREDEKVATEARERSELQRLLDKYGLPEPERDMRTASEVGADTKQGKAA